MIKKIQSYLRKPFLVWEYTIQRKWIVFIGIMVFSIIFKIAYQPFGISPNTGLTFFINHALITAGILFFQIFLLPQFLGNYFQEDKRTVGREILWAIVLFIVLIFFHSLYSIAVDSTKSVWAIIKIATWVTIGIGIFPISFLFILARIRQLKEKQLRTKEKEVPVVEKITERFEGISIADIICIKSLDNYSEIHYLDTQEEAKKIIRKSLLVIENKLTSKGFLRVHRSFIVNLKFIENVEGNANKTMIKIKKSGLLIPVSRAKREEVLMSMKFRDNLL